MTTTEILMSMGQNRTDYLKTAPFRDRAFQIEGLMIEGVVEAGQQVATHWASMVRDNFGTIWSGIRKIDETTWTWQEAHPLVASMMKPQVMQ